MTTTFFAPDPWQAISDVARKAGPRYAAIAFLGAAAPDLLEKFGRRDVIVANAGDDALVAHATSPDALQAFLDRGVRLVSSSRLHAKVLATQTTAVVGSANASRNSLQSSEAVIVTDQRSIVAYVKAFVEDEISQGTEIDELFIEHAHTVWEQSSRTWTPNVPGVTGAPPRVVRHLPDPLECLYLDNEEPADYSEEAKGLERERRAVVRSTLGPRSKYRLDSWLVHGDMPYRNGDVMILIRTAGTRISVRPPSVVVDVAPVPRRKNQYLVTLRYRSKDRTLPRKDALAELGKAGLPDYEFEGDGTKITDATELSALLGLWSS